MSGGYFGYCGEAIENARGEWGDEELNEMFDDLFGSSRYRRGRPFGSTVYDSASARCEFGPRGGGLFESLDFWLSGDTTYESYQEDVRRFKAKWFRKTPKNRLEFYKDRFEEYAREIMEKFKEELGDV